MKGLDQVPSRFLKGQPSQFSKVSFQADIELARVSPHQDILFSEHGASVVCPMDPADWVHNSLKNFSPAQRMLWIWLCVPKGMSEPPNQTSFLADSVFRAFLFVPLLSSYPGVVHCMGERKACSNTCVLKSSRKRALRVSFRFKDQMEPRQGDFPATSRIFFCLPRRSDGMSTSSKLEVTQVLLLFWTRKKDKGNPRRMQNLSRV